MCACDAVCVFVFPVCTCIEISVVLSYYVLRCHYIIELAGEREWGVGGCGVCRADGTWEGFRLATGGRSRVGKCERQWCVWCLLSGESFDYPQIKVALL